MIPGLHQGFDQPDRPAAVGGSLPEHPDKELRGHELGAGAGDQKASVLHQSHAAQVQLLVAPVGALQSLFALGKGRRVADDQAEIPFLVLIPLDQVEDVGLHRGDLFLHAVQRRVLPQHFQGLAGHVHSLHSRCPIEGRVDRKAAGVAAEIQYVPTLAVRPDPAPVFLLIQEVAGFLPVGDVHQHPGFVLPDLHQRRHPAVDTAGALGQAFLFPDGHVVPLIDPLWQEDFRQDLNQLLFPPLHAQADDLKAQIVPEFVHGESRQSVGLSEHHPAGIGKAQSLPVIPGPLDPAAEKGGVDALVPVPAQDPDRDPGPAVEKPVGQEAKTAVDDLHDLAVLAQIIHPVDLVVKDPQAAGPDVGSLASAEADLTVCHQPSPFRVQMKCQASRHISSTVFSAVQWSTSWARVGLA